jgi:hypothetical protein
MSIASSFKAPATTEGSWHRLLRFLGVEAWFRRAPATAHASQQERTFLLLSLLPAQCDAQSALCLEGALQGCLPLIRAEGGEVLSFQGHTLLLSWPATPAGPPAQAVQTYFRFCQFLGQLAPPLAAALCGATGLGQVRATGRRYRGEVMRQVAGMLPEAQQLGGLLISAALRHYLPETTAMSYTLHVAFGLRGHRYPATLFRAVPVPHLQPPIQPGAYLADKHSSSGQGSVLALVH